MDGISVFSIDGPRPFTAQLVFRVGIFDEALSERGVTHIVEHLSLYPLRSIEIGFNGFVSPQLTTFVAQGHPAEVGAFLRQVCDSIHQLPFDRLDVEAKVLRREGSLQRWSYFDMIMWAYFGFRGPGVGGTEEFGLDWLSPSTIEQWASRYFTRQNAAILIVGDVPDSFGLELPDGDPIPYRAPKRPKPAPEEPTLFSTQNDGVTWGTLVRHPKGDVDPELYTGLEIVAQRLEQRLRHELGHSYAIGRGSHRIDADYVAASLGYDCEQGESRAVAVEHLAVMREFAEQGPTQEEIDRNVRVILKAHEDHPQVIAQQFLYAEAETYLAGWGSTAPDDVYLHQFERLTPQSVAERFAEAYRQSYTIARLRPSEMPSMPTPAQTSVPPFSGVQYVSKRKHRPTQATLIRIGEDGVSLRYSDGWVNNALDALALVIPDEQGLRVLGDMASTQLESDKYVSSSPFRKRAVRVWTSVTLAAVAVALQLLVNAGIFSLIGVVTAMALAAADIGDEYESTARTERRLPMQEAARKYLHRDLVAPEPRDKRPSSEAPGHDTPS